MTDEQVRDCTLKFADELVQLLNELKKNADAECERLRDSGDSADAWQREWLVLECIERAARVAELHKMASVAADVQESLSLRDSLALENWSEHKAKESARNREKNEAAKRRRLAKQPANHSPTTSVSNA